MVVYHFTAPDMVTQRGWQPMATFPQDKSVVEVRDESGNVAKAFWEFDRLVVGIDSPDRPGLGELVYWRRIIEED